MNILIQQYKLFNNNNLMIDYILYHAIMIYDEINDPNLLLNVEYINYKDLEFRLDSNNLRIPYLNNQKIIAIKINLNNIYNYISSLKLISNDQIICGEYIQNLADIVIGNETSLSFNPNNLFFSKKINTINNLNNINDYNIIFIFTHDLEFFYNKFENNLSNKIIISHNSDNEIKYIKNVKFHLAQNCLIKNNKLLSIPIGIENSQWFDHKIFYNVRKMNLLKNKNIYFYFNMNTHPSRINCYNELKDKLTWNSKKNKEEYFIELSQHKYAICPRGNGIDTHRIWECLYLNVIPIIIKSDFLNIDNLPIIILDNWSDIDNINNYKFINQISEKLTLNYYKKYIYNLTNEAFSSINP